MTTRPRATSRAREAQFVHHDSPFGPAVSVYPKNYGGEKRRGVVQHHRNDDNPSYDDRLDAAATTTTTTRPRVIVPEPVRPRPMSLEHCESFCRQSSSSHTPASATMAIMPPPPPRTTSRARTTTRTSFTTSTAPNDTTTTTPSPNRTRRVTPPPPPMIEVSPGLRLRYRGSAETKACIRNDFFVPTLCSGCGKEIFCIQDAAYCLCPHCRIIGPLWESKMTLTMSEEEGGVGLGFTLRDIQDIQWDMLSRQGSQMRGGRY